MKTQVLSLLTIGILSLTAQAAEKTMHILRSATTTNDTWVAAIGGLDEGDTLVFDTSDFTAVGGGSAVNFGNVVTPPLAGLKFTGTSMGVNMQGITINLQDGAVIDLGEGSFRIVFAVSALNPGKTDFTRVVRRGEGLLQLESTGGGALLWTLEGGTTMIKYDAALGTPPESFRADAIVMAGGCLTTDLMGADGDVHLSPNRGITVASGATAEFANRIHDVDLYLSKITGNGNVRIDGTPYRGKVFFTAANDYTGETIVGGAGIHNGDNGCLSFTENGALPATTSVYGGGAVHATLDLAGTSQSAVAVNDNGDAAGPLSLRGGTLSVGAAAATTSARNVTVGEGAALRLAAGSLNAAASLPLILAAGTTVNVGALTAFTDDIVLEGNATLSADGDFTLGGAVTRAEGASSATLSVSVGGTFTYGQGDDVLRPVTADVFSALSPAPDILDGLIWSDLDLSGYTKGSSFLLFGPSANAQTAVNGTTVGYAGSGLDDGASVTVSNGGCVKVYTDGSTVVDRAFALDATSTLALTGSGRITLSGTVTGGTVTVADGVEVFVPTGETLTLASAVNGTLVKTGGGTLAFAGAVAGACALTLKEGTARLGASAVAVAEVTVEEGATLALDADEQIADTGTVTLRGTFDLNGHAETVLSVGNRTGSDAIRDDVSARIVNSSAAPASLATVGASYFYGRAEETAGSISLSFASNGSGRPVIGGAPESFAVSSITAANDGLMMYNQHTRYVFTFRKRRDGAASGVALTEIQLTCGGVPIPQDAYSTSSSASSTAAGNVMNLFDGKASTAWVAGAGEATVRVVLKRYMPVDGYRICPREINEEPLDWDVYAYRSGYLGTVLMDSRRNTHLLVDGDYSGFRLNLSSNFLFSSSARVAEPFGAGTALSLPTAGRDCLQLAGSGPVRMGAVSGPGHVQLQCGTTWAPGDLSAWTGSLDTQYATNAESQVTVLLDAARGPSAQRVNLCESAEMGNVTFGNAGTTPVALLADDATVGTLRGRLADVNGPMGLVKRGAGTVVTEMQGAENTGVTAIETGRLRVIGPRRTGLAVTAHHVRITPTEVHGGKGWHDGNGYNWGMNEFQLLDAEGNAVAWPSDRQLSADNNGAGANGFANLIDGNINTRCIIWNVGKSGTSSVLPPVTISSVTGFTFGGYRWHTPHGNPTDANRTPVALTLEVSDDGQSWMTVDVRRVPWVEDSTSFASGKPGILRGPFTLGGESTGTDTLYTLPSAFFAEATARDSSAPALTARYFRFEPFSTSNPQLSNVSYGWMISEFSLFRNGERLDWPSDATVSVVGGTVADTNNSKVRNLINNLTADPDNGKVQGKVERCFVTEYPSYAQIDAHRNVAFDAYGFWSSAGGGYDGRIPTGWRVWASQDGVDWQLIDAKADMKGSITVREYALQGPWNVARKFPLLNANNGAGNAIGDASPVAISADAALEIAADYEKFGTLSGAGTLELVNGATAEINAIPATPAGMPETGGAQLVAPAAFSGTISGSGTLVVSGVATQAFNNATLSGVTTLELNGGTVTGTASAPGALTVACGGGTWFGELAASGALTVTGAPVIGLPSDPGASFRKTLFTYTSINATSAASLAAATFDPSVTLPKGLKPHVNVGTTSCVLTVAADGTIVIFR